MSASSLGKRPPCKYGSDCYRKHLEHRSRFCHPGDDDWAEVCGAPAHVLLAIDGTVNRAAAPRASDRAEQCVASLKADSWADLSDGRCGAIEDEELAAALRASMVDEEPATEM